MNGNSAYLNSLKRTTVTREKQNQSKIWGAFFVFGSVIATYYANDYSTKGLIAGVAVLVVAVLYLTAVTPVKDMVSSSRSNQQDMPVPAKSAPALRSNTISNSLLSPTKLNYDTGKHQDRQGADWNENFDVQSPQRITQAVLSELQQQQDNSVALGPSGTGLMPASTLYPNANTAAYVGKTNVANLGYQYTGNTYSSTFGSPAASAASATAFNRSNINNSSPAPAWHTYHSSPTTEMTRSASPLGLYRSGSGGKAMSEEEDPLNDIVSRASSAHGNNFPEASSPFASRNLSVGIPSNFVSHAFSPSRSGRSFTTPSSVRNRGGGGAGGAGMTEDRLEHVLTKYLESQEQIVRELAQEILRQLTERAAIRPAPFLQNQEDVGKLRLLLELQVDRQVMSSRSLLGLSELIRQCRSAGLNEDLLRRYEAAVAVLQSPNHTSYSNPSTPHSQSHSQSQSMGHSQEQGQRQGQGYGPSLISQATTSFHTSSGSGAPTVAGSGQGAYGAYGASRMFAEPASSSGASFTSSRRSRR